MLRAVTLPQNRLNRQTPKRLNFQPGYGGFHTLQNDLVLNMGTDHDTGAFAASAAVVRERRSFAARHKAARAFVQRGPNRARPDRAKLRLQLGKSAHFLAA